MSKCGHYVMRERALGQGERICGKPATHTSGGGELLLCGAHARGWNHEVGNRLGRAKRLDDEAKEKETP